MDIGGINRIKASIKPMPTDNKKSLTTSTDRDAQGNTGYHQKKKPTYLTPAQEQEALEKLNAMPAFAGSGLKAELMRDEGTPAHIVVRDKSGEIVRHLAYEQIVEIYLQRNLNTTTGRLINRAA